MYLSCHQENKVAVDRERLAHSFFYLILSYNLVLQDDWALCRQRWLTNYKVYFS